MKKGINQWCFPKGTPLKQLLETSARAGFDTVELNLYAPGGVGLTMETTPQEAKEIGALVASYGLSVSSLSTEMLGRHPLSSPDAETREQGVRSLRKQIELAAALEVADILVVPGRVTPETTYEEVWSRSRTELEPLVPELETAGVYMGIENVWNKFLWSPTEMARYIDEFASPHVGAYFDVGNTLAFGQPQHWIRTLGRRIRQVHVKDFKTAVGNGHGFVPLLAGDVNWIAVREALEAIGYDGPLTAELDAYASFPDQLVYDTARHIAVIIGQAPN
ncbi:hexulose-6-phosphate isomerase [Paenibacillus sp. J31TS4]|uniref:sugar phosphate isomerase/epimerase family protein n=1 Tax=Paenibacillus sp. J31TS4 TaxID=2807195 RepID=UPI001B113EAF|nr:sugar phosphate isomerase/epimerase family protein [Paenibacillus sp. J31TS4]GIP37170.1 hexulose-6-phosphate isomerase [Paenibacillus sp. J31TS4]